MRPVISGAIACGAVFSLTQLAAIAGGPLAFDANGAFTWVPGQTIHYSVDKGGLGSFREPAPQDLAQAALDRWSQAATTLTFQRQLLDENVTSAIRYIELESDHRAGNVLVLDDRGDIVAKLTGEANRDQILGWASPLLDGRKIGRFVSLMNGALASNKATLESTLTHEFGHALGLDHAQINSDFANNRKTGDDKFLPTMFPTSTDDDSSLVELNPDDIAWIRHLYPAETTRKLYGSLTGRIVRGGKPVLGANVVAIRMAGPRGVAVDSLMDRFSCVSDYLANTDGSFRMQVLPGKYKLRVEPLRRGFSGGFSVGPHAEKPDSPSFADPVAILDHTRVFEVAAGATVDVGAIVVR